MAQVLESFSNIPGIAPDQLQVVQLESADRLRCAPQLAPVQRVAWSQRYVHELGAATMDEIWKVFSDQAFTDKMADMDATEGRTTYLVAELTDSADNSGAIAGFIRTARYQPADRHKLTYPYIKDINTLAPAGHGIGSMLMDRALAQFPIDRRVALYAHDVNIPALAWYRRLGFSMRRVNRTNVCLGTIEFSELHMEAPSVNVVRTNLLPVLKRWGYGPASVDVARIAQNA